MSKFFQIETGRGQAVEFRGAQLIPVAQSSSLRFPGLPGGLAWKRPVSVLVIAPDGSEQALPVRDITRQVLWILLGLTALASLILGLTINYDRSVSDDRQN
jgi:hypothetical protein